MRKHGTLSLIKNSHFSPLKLVKLLEKIILLPNMQRNLYLSIWKTEEYTETHPSRGHFDYMLQKIFKILSPFDLVIPFLGQRWNIRISMEKFQVTFSEMNQNQGKTECEEIF